MTLFTKPCDCGLGAGLTCGGCRGADGGGGRGCCGMFLSMGVCSCPPVCNCTLSNTPKVGRGLED